MGDIERDGMERAGDPPPSLVLPTYFTFYPNCSVFFDVWRGIRLQKLIQYSTECKRNTDFYEGIKTSYSL